MKPALLIGGIIVVAGVAGFLAFSGKGEQASQNNQEQTVQTEEKSNGSSMRALLASTNPQKCEFTDETEAGKTEGTVFIANGKMRGDFKIESKDQTSMSHMIIVDSTMHSWSDAYPTMGVKLAFDANASASSQTPGQPVDADKQIDYKCEDWSTDESQFALPATVTFQDMSSFMVPPLPAQ